MDESLILDYGYRHGGAGWAHAYLWPAIDRLVQTLGPRRILEIGCGNGSTANRFARRGGIEIVAVELSDSGLAQARAAMDPAFPVRFERMSAYDDLAGRFGHFDLVLCLEVIEHLYSPRLFVDRAHEALVDGGRMILSTPFHGYWKYLALALSGKCDQHFNPLWDGGHIKFWSERTLCQLLNERGFEVDRFERVGRIAPVAKSMILTARRMPRDSACGEQERVHTGGSP
jgi:2-polyprenyl-6-hydroxyphenyl methylase/3-demethylubiquinone-9 3-methyltransferase